MSRKGPGVCAVAPKRRLRHPRVVILDRAAQHIAIMSSHWFERFAGRFHFPQNYTTVDVETNGVSPTQSFICSIGHTIVRAGVPTQTNEVYLNWPNHPDINHEQFQQDLLRTQVAMERQGKPFHHTWEVLRNQGEDPIEVLRNHLDLFEQMEARREVAVMHNGWRFDVEFFQAHFHNWLRIPFVFDPELVYDTGIAEKASQLQDQDDPLPLAGETMQQFAWRIGGLRRRGVFWALDSHCNERYKLFEKAGMAETDAHRSGADSLLLCHLMNSHAELAGMSNKIDLSVEGNQTVVVDDADGEG